MADPPEPTPFRIISVTNNLQGEVAVFWEYLKPDEPTTIATLFLVSEGEIREMEVIFTAHDQEARFA